MSQTQSNIFSSLKLRTIPLGEVVEELKAGFSSGKFELDKGDIAHLRPMNIDNDCKLTLETTKYISHSLFEEKQEYNLIQGDILFNNTNSTELVGKSCYIREDLTCGYSNHMTRIRVKHDKVNSVYLSNILFGMFKNKILESYCHKWVGQSGINTEILSNILVPIPPLPEQIQIAELFQCIDTVIEQAQQQEKNLTALQKTLSYGLVNTQPSFGNLLNDRNCTLTTFGGIVDCIEQHDKQKKDISCFIGLEDIESENLHIATWGNISDGTTFTKRFSKGDVLFGKRRAYLKKVAIADFDGICSGDILVLRAKDKTILPELLPFYASAEAFIQHAINTSAGSLSPRTKWKDLSSFQFAIPELKAQEKILEVFQQLRLTVEHIKTQIQTLKNLKQKLLNEILG